MSPGPVKNYHWVLIVAMMILIALLSGCSSAPRVQAQKSQFCYTNQTIETVNKEEVTSKTTVKCSDDPVERITEVRVGIAGNCGEFMYWTKIGGVNVQRSAISCQKMDGSWHILPSSFSR
jgi:hypothetical protein